MRSGYPTESDSGGPGILPWFLYILALLASCGASSAETVLNTPPPAWEKLEADNAFSLDAPPGSEYVRRQGMDSLVGVFATPGFDLVYDYGLYSPSLDNPGAYQDYSVREAEIDGRPARIVRAYDPARTDSRPWFSGLHVLGVKSASPLGTVSLSIHGWLANPADYEIAERIFETIRFKEHD